MKIISEKVVAWRRPGVPGAELSPVVLQRLAEDRCQWRVEFAGQGHYFKDESAAWQYVCERFGAVRE